MLADDLQHHLASEVDSTLAAVNDFLDVNELPGGVVVNLRCVQKQLQLASNHMAAACLLAAREAQ